MHFPISRARAQPHQCVLHRILTYPSRKIIVIRAEPAVLSSIIVKQPLSTDLRAACIPTQSFTTQRRPSGSISALCEGIALGSSIKPYATALLLDYVIIQLPRFCCIKQTKNRPKQPFALLKWNWYIENRIPRQILHKDRSSEASEASSVSKGVVTNNQVLGGWRGIFECTFPSSPPYLSICDHALRYARCFRCLTGPIFM